MKSLSQHINEKLIDEKLLINKDFNAGIYHYVPKNKKELIEMIRDHYANGVYDLNDIDTSEIEDFSQVFLHDDNTGRDDFDVSEWDVSKGKNFSEMFMYCYGFNCDIGNWDVSNGIDFHSMFYECKKFNCDLSRWDVSSGIDFRYMFAWCEKFKCNISRWKNNKKPISVSAIVFNSGMTEKDLPSWAKK